MSLVVKLYRYRLVLALALAAGTLFLLVSRSLHSDSWFDTLIGDGSLERPRGGINRHWPEAPSPAGFVRAVLAQNRVVVFSKTTCPYCKATKALLESYREQYGLRYVAVEADQRNDMSEVKLALADLCQRSTFPSVFIDSKCIGGNSDIRAKHASGELQKILVDAELLPMSKLEEHRVELLKSTRKIVADNLVTVFGRISDANTAQAVAILRGYRSEHSGFAFQFTDLDERTDHLQLVKVVHEIYGQSNLPVVL
ncbi:hypothetical protein GGI21_006636, partial [Coemansia aciculifera]